MKAKRQNMILKLVSEKNISTQEELQQELRSAGFEVTQATVSRDIRELALIKTCCSSGKYKYAVPALKRSSIDRKDSMILTILSDAVTSVDSALNIVVVKCHVGMAQAVCAKLDNAELDNVVGTIAGDDTIFMLMRSEKDASRLVKELSIITNK
ncbi:arginine repressor [Ruminococcus sp. Marseille-P6503]|uniref:arginine repressor n=1 Tax=Ruminococcus sp. Marseille-P6503 TaxID=2364796 RepID=UPI000F540AC4|nr:arginine repressor [Ruminococcus sp. Marseille-P6503]